MQDVAFGQGDKLTLGETQQTTLELYPAVAAVRLTMDTARIELFRQERPTIAEQGVVFTQVQPDYTLSLTVSPTGSVVFSLTPHHNALEAPQTPLVRPRDISYQNAVK